MRLALAWCVLLTACSSDRNAELGVDVFSNDTLPAPFTVTVSGSLAIGIRAESFAMRKDKSLGMTTPASLVIDEGEGEAEITALRPGQRIAVRPINAPPDSVDADVVGSSVLLTRKGKEHRIDLRVQKP